MKLVLISDSHGQHNEVSIPDGDILIHAGDVSSRGGEREIDDFLQWFSKQNHKHKIFIAGNHDFFFERADSKIIHDKIPEEIIYLNDSGTEIEGLKIWGSPIQPEFFDWAFNRKRGAEIKKHWDLIPEGTDILITHGPPFGILDKTIRGAEEVGCKELLNRIKIIKPRIHLFGHIHEAYGMLQKEETIFVNASVLDVRYRPVNKAVVLEM